jgi:two-component system cell cycle sensor histidine kinase/response regulator CckA
MAALRPKPSETILVVDDDADVLSLATDILKIASYTVLSAQDPLEALKIVRTHAEPIHLLLTDIVMPNMTGLQLAEEVRTIRPEIKILFMSSHRTDEIEEYRVRLASKGLFLDKPFTVAWLEKTVRTALESPTVIHWPPKK